LKNMAKKRLFGLDPKKLDKILSIGTENADGADIEYKKLPTTREDTSAKRIDAPSPTASLEIFAEKPGSQIGRYKLLSVLGEGGMGIVYLAEQQRPIRRQVALKVIKPGMDSKRIIARFEAERQALALLDHANIAHVHDAGTTESGRPFFVMEYVKGLPITEYCDRHKLTIDTRLNLFLKVCNAIQHAHQKGIIHRDIKPSNILVSLQDDQAIPKIIDFGVAKAIAQPLTEHTLATENSQLLGTPEYMSPEQVDMASEDIDTRSDVYSLGVLLYVLLTGVLPFDSDTLREGGIDNIRLIIREIDPKTPSTRFMKLGEEAKKIAEKRRIEVAALAKCLHKELEWVPLKAMRKERTERYRSASELADDVENYLKGNPLIAGPPSTVYRLKKLIQKHRTQVIAAATMAILIAGMAVISIMYIQAVNRGKEAESLKDTDILSKAMEFRSNGQFQEALTKVKAVLKSKYVGPKARLLRARIILELQGPAEAVKELEKLLNESDEIVCQAHFLLARIYLESDPGDPETTEEYQRKAKEHQQKGEKLFSESPEAYYNRSMMAGSVNSILKWLDKALELNPSHYDSLEARALANYALKKYDDMMEDASVMIGNESSNQRGFALRAIARREKAIKQNDNELLSQAIKDHNRAIKLSPDDAELYDQRRRTHLQMGNYQQVLSDAQECVRLQPDKGIYHFHVFCALVALGRYDETKIKYDTIIDSGLMKKSEFNESVAKYVSDTLDDGLSWHPPESMPEGAAFLSMHESDEIYHQLVKKATRVVPEGFIPTWSPDGTEIAYTRGIHGFTGIEIMNLESGKTRLLVVPGFDSVWSPDGRHIAFVRARKAVLLTELTTEYGAQISLHSQREVWIIKADGTEEPRFLAKGHSISWSIDSKHIYYHSPNDMKLYSVSIEDGAEPIPIVSCPGSYPTVSPDEKYVAYMWGGGLQIVELSTKSVVMSWTAPPIPWVGASQYWSRNGRELGIQGFDGLWIYNLDTKTVANVLRGEIAWCSWSRSDINQFAFHRQYRDLHRAIWVAKLDPNVSTAEALGPGRTIEEYYQDMIDYYTRRINTSSEGPASYLFRAECYIYLQNREKASDDLEQCAKLLGSHEHPAAAFVTMLAVLCREQKRYDEVKPEFVKVLEFSRDLLGQKDPYVLNQLAWFQATFPVAEFRNGTNAIKYATKACELTNWKNFSYVDALAASYAEAGDFESAVKWQKEAISLLSEEQISDWLAAFQARLDLYQSGKPYRQSP
jgi:serine/threonine protein kinase